MPLAESRWSADTSIDLLEMTVPQLLAERAAQHPDRLALVAERHGGEPARLTYAELLRESQAVATALSRITEPGDRVALWAPNVAEWVVVQHGAAIAGVVLVALNPVLRHDELAYAVDHSGARVLLHAERSRDHDMAAVAGRIAADRPDLAVVPLSAVDTWRGGDVDGSVVAAPPTDPSDAVMLQYTSGTTGRPKGVLLRHRSLVNVARFTMLVTGVREGAVAVNPLPMFHTAACVVGTLGPLVVGGTEVLVHQFKPVSVLQALRDEDAEVLFFVPAVLGALLEAQRTSELPAPRLRVVMGGASNVPAAMIEAAEGVFGADVVNLFGQTELSPVLSATRPGDAREDQLRTIGRPLPQVDVTIVDPADGRVLPLGVTGEIRARGYQQLVEYLHDPDATARAVDAEGFVCTGDLGAMDERGYLTLTGRLKDLIIRGGENIAPAAVESALAEHPAVLQAVVFGLPDDRMGEIVAAALHWREDVGPVDVHERVRDVERHCRERISPFMVPARWFVAGELPTTPTGKVQKFLLPALVGGEELREVRSAD